MGKHNEYIENIKSIISQIEENCGGSIEATACALSKALIEGRRIFLFGTGHSHMLCEELFYRAGGLLNIQPVLIESLMLHIDAAGSTAAEREEGLADKIFNDYGMKADDVIVIISNSGRNGVVIDMALLCKEKGLTVIALTNLRHTMAGASRHGSGKRLCEIADITLDNCGCVGDACIEIDGIDGKICATSTVAGAMILNAAVARAVEICADNGFYPEHFCSANIDGGDDINNRLIEKYKKEIKHL